MNTPPVEIPKVIIDDIEAERGYSSQYWDKDFDSLNTINDWAAYINIYLARGTKVRTNTDRVEESVGAMHRRQREALVKAASLCISALEAFDNNGAIDDVGFFEPRHYD